MVVARRGKMRIRRCILKLKCRRLVGLDVVGKIQEESKLCLSNLVDIGSVLIWRNGDGVNL